MDKIKNFTKATYQLLLAHLIAIISIILCISGMIMYLDYGNVKIYLGCLILGKFYDIIVKLILKVIKRENKNEKY